MTEEQRTALFARLDKLAESLRVNTGPPLSGTFVDVVEAVELLRTWANALSYVATHTDVNVAQARRNQMVAAGGLYHCKRPAEVLR